MQELDTSGIPIIGKKVEDRYLLVGEGVFGGNNMGRLTGLKADDTAVIETETGSEGEVSKYLVTVKNVQEEIFPKLDEEFIKKVDGEATDETSFRLNILKRIEERLERESEDQLNEVIVDYFIQSTKLEPPPSMVDSMIDTGIEQAKSNNGKTFDEEQYRSESRPSVTKSVKWYLIRKALLKLEDLSVRDEELESHIEEILQSSKDEEGQIRRFYKKSSNRERLRDDLLNRNLFEKLKEYAKVTEVPIATSDLRKQRELATEGV